MILVTGGMGFIGLHTAHELLGAGDDLVITRHRIRREPEFLSKEFGGRVTVEIVDVADPYSVFDIMERYDVESVIHLAVPELNRLEPAEEARENVTGLLNVLEAARIHQVRRLSIASSVTVYADTERCPWREDLPLPIASPNATGAFKKITETLVEYYAERTGLDVILLRIGHIYGPLYHSMANLPSRLVHGAVGRVPFPNEGGEPLYDDDGMDYCYVRDCARGIRQLHLAGHLDHRVFNIGGGRVTTNRELVEAVRRVHPEFQPRMVPGALTGLVSGERYMDLTRASAAVGYRPEYTVEEAIEEYLAWLETHEE